jgi:methylated-DNA-protein-cysteine methyltransferase-like protein
VTGASGTRPFETCVVDVLRRLPPGEVVSYGEVAAEAGYPGAARAVGNLLAGGLEDVPWWRVVRSNGTLVSGHARKQAALLAAEGVTVVDGRIRPWGRNRGHQPIGAVGTKRRPRPAR